MATLRYLQWYYLNHMVYGACALIAVCAMFQVIFFGMKFDSEHMVRHATRAENAKAAYRSCMECVHARVAIV